MWKYHSSIPLRADFLMHHGIKGQKWGVRRFQNEDGTLTPDGKERYQNLREISKIYRAEGEREKQLAKQEHKFYERVQNETPEQYLDSYFRDWRSKRFADEYGDPIKYANEAKKSELKDILKNERRHIKKSEEWMKASEDLLNRKLDDITDREMEKHEQTAIALNREYNRKKISDAANSSGKDEKNVKVNVRASIPEYNAKAKKEIKSTMSDKEIHDTVKNFYNLFKKLGMPKSSLGDWTNKSEDEQLWYFLHIADQIGLG